MADSAVGRKVLWGGRYCGEDNTVEKTILQGRH